MAIRCASALLLRPGHFLHRQFHDAPSRTQMSSYSEAHSHQVGNELSARGADQGHPQRNLVTRGWSIAANLSTAFSPGAAIANAEHCLSHNWRGFSETFVVSDFRRSRSETTR